MHTNNSKLITLKAAHDYVKGNCKYVKLGELRELCIGVKRNLNKQGWTFIGTTHDWKRAVQPWYNS